MIQAERITKSFNGLQVLKNVSLYVNKAEVISIVGASGAGKTTLLQIIGTLTNPDSGKVIYNNTEITKLNEKQLAAFRNKQIGFVFQFHHLLPEFTALENVCMPAFIADEPRKRAEDRAKKILADLNLEHRFNHKPSELSGGEQQRVAVARALINNPAAILADEPSGNLDTAHKRELHELFFTLRDKFSQTFIIVTHDNELAAMTDRKLEMADGQFI